MESWERELQERNLQKAINTELGFHAPIEEFTKGKAHPLGTRRVWGGVEYEKKPEGWMPTGKKGESKREEKDVAETRDGEKIEVGMIVRLPSENDHSRPGKHESKVISIKGGEVKLENGKTFNGFQLYYPRKEEKKEKEKSTFKDEKLRKTDERINTSEILSKLDIPPYLYHVTNRKNRDGIQKSGLVMGQKKTDDVGESEGRVYLTGDPYSILDFTDISDPVIVKVSTKGVNLRLDPEYYGEDNTSEIISRSNKKTSLLRDLYMYTTNTISKDNIHSIHDSVSDAIK